MAHNGLGGQYPYFKAPKPLLSPSSKASKASKAPNFATSSSSHSAKGHGIFATAAPNPAGPTARSGACHGDSTQPRRGFKLTKHDQTSCVFGKKDTSNFEYYMILPEGYSTGPEIIISYQTFSGLLKTITLHLGFWAFRNSWTLSTGKLRLSRDVWKWLWWC